VIQVPIPVALGAQPIEVVVPLLGTALKLLLTMNETWEKARSEKRTGAKAARENLEFDTESKYLEDLPAGPAWVHRASFKELLSEAPWS
jgi:hypothetical protein